MTRMNGEIESSDVRKLLSLLPFFSSLTDDELLELQNVIRRRQFKKNTVILAAEDSNSYMYIVVSGKVKVVRTGTDGKEQIFAIHKRGDFFGEMALLDGKTSPAAVVALEDTTVGLIYKADFDQYLLANEKVAKCIIDLLCVRLRDAWLMLRVLSCSDAEQRVRTVLNHLGSSYGIPDSRGTIIPMKLTHRDIAGYANLARETVSRFMVSLQREKEIEIDSHQIVLTQAFKREEL